MCSLYLKLKCILNNINPCVFINSWNNTWCYEGKMFQGGWLPRLNNLLVAQLWPWLPSSCPRPLTSSQGQSHLCDPDVKMRMQVGHFDPSVPQRAQFELQRLQYPTPTWILQPDDSTGGNQPSSLPVMAESCTWSSEALSSTDKTAWLASGGF